MDAVALIQCRVGGDTLEEERHERDVILTGKRGVHLMECDDVITAEVPRGFHPGQHDLDVPGLRALDDVRQILLERLGRQRAQRVVAAQRDDEHSDITVERPVET